ncbi:MAG: glycosyltransferase family 2 protein [Gaiellaceae bacterium]
MTDATILIPTYRHAALLPYAMRSALAQEGVEVELFVVGDGVEDDSRAAVAPFLSDSRVRFFDSPKGERHGERLRHDALQESSAPIVCYLSDDDLLLPEHVAEMRRLLEDADLAHDAPVNVSLDGSLRYNAFDLGRPEFVELLVQGRGGGGLTGVAHTRSAYERLPFGWRPAPRDIPTDIYMWQQFSRLPDFKGATGERLTTLVFPSPLRTEMSVAERAAELECWERRMVEPGFSNELQGLVHAAARRATERLKLTAMDLERELERVQGTRWWRARRLLAELRPMRALRARRREAR